MGGGYLFRGASQAGGSALWQSALLSGPNEASLQEIQQCAVSASGFSREVFLSNVLRRLHQVRVAAVVW